MPIPPASSPILNLALQGGGAHGAFTWGVLDALLAEGTFEIEGISGTSAGAMNALCVGHGLMTGGRDGARQTLTRFWTGVAGRTPFATGGEAGPAPSAAIQLLRQWTDYFSPAQLNPLDLNPLRDLLHEQFDFERLRRDCPVKLFIAATHANSGRLRIFDNHELSADALLASACLPTLHRTVIIDGEPYWDGGYSANPAIFPLVWQCRAADILLVLLSPLRYADTPASTAQIRHRLIDLSFNATFLREMHMFAQLRADASQRRRAARMPQWLRRCLTPRSATGNQPIRRIDTLHFHAITADAALSELPAESKLAVNQPFLEHLRDLGHIHAQDWLARHHADLGKRGSLDLGSIF